MRSVVFAVLLTAILSLPCLAQLGRSNGSTKAALTVYVELTNERALGKSIEVRVYQRGQVLFGENFTDERGRAKFDRVPAGYYHIEVQGTGIEKTVGAEFEILDMEGAHTETVRAKPAVDANAADNAVPAGNAATVSATELKIPEKAQKEFDRGVDAFSAGDNKKAEESFNKAIEDYPKYANAYSNLGVLYIKLGRQAKAKEAFTKAVTVDTKFVPGYVNLARVSFAAHNYPETESNLNKALAISPDNLDALALLATTEYMNKENDKALANVRHIHSLPAHEPFSGVHLLAAQILLAENERDQAIDQYVAFLQESPNDLRVPAVRKTLAQMKAGQH
jgi:cytochrome c-type biogenesis protein CcmH/NrfG